MFNVWRIHLKTAYALNNEKQKELMEYCINRGIVGVGWQKINVRIDDEFEIKRLSKENYPGDQGCFQALNAMRKIEVGDFIWTRSDKIYYLGKVITKWMDTKPCKTDFDYDINNFVEVKLIEIVHEDMLPKSIVLKFTQSAIMCTNGIEDLTQHFWNRFNNE